MGVSVHFSVFKGFIILSKKYAGPTSNLFFFSANPTIWIKLLNSVLFKIIQNIFPQEKCKKKSLFGGKVLHKSSEYIKSVRIIQVM